MRAPWIRAWGDLKALQESPVWKDGRMEASWLGESEGERLY
jgi:hypothetical protein